MATEILTKEQINEIGGIIGAMLKNDLGQHITDLLPSALKHHGIDPEALKSPLKRVPLSEAAHATGPTAPAIYGGWAPDYRSKLLAQAQQPTEWKRFGEFLTSMFVVAHPELGRGMDARLKVLNETDPQAGGFLVPEPFIAQLLMMSLEMAVVRPRAFVLPMTSETLRIPANRDSSHATTVFGGVVAYWGAEQAAMTASDPVFRQIVLTAKKLYGHTKVTNETLADSAISLEALLSRMFGEAIAFYEDKAFIEGNGAGQPQGILGSGATISVAKETGQAATTLVAENLDKMYARMLPGSLNRAIWIANPNVFPQLASLSRSVGTGGSAVWMANIAGAPPATIYGRPVIFTEKCKGLGTTGDIYFVDFSYYLIGDRQSITMAASTHVDFLSDLTSFKFVERLDGQPWIDVALTPLYGDSASPIVKLDARA